VPGVVDVHDLHAWTITSGMPALSAHVTVTGTHPGTFPAEGGAPGHGKYEYEAGFLPGGLPDDFPFVFQIGDGTWDGNSFDRATAKICAALT